MGLQREPYDMTCRVYADLARVGPASAVRLLERCPWSGTLQQMQNRFNTWRRTKVIVRVSGDGACFKAVHATLMPYDELIALRNRRVWHDGSSAVVVVEPPVVVVAPAKAPRTYAWLVEPSSGVEPWLRGLA